MAIGALTRLLGKSALARLQHVKPRGQRTPIEDVVLNFNESEPMAEAARLVDSLGRRQGVEVLGLGDLGSPDYFIASDRNPGQVVMPRMQRLRTTLDSQLRPSDRRPFTVHNHPGAAPVPSDYDLRFYEDAPFRHEFNAYEGDNTHMIIGHEGSDLYGPDLDTSYTLFDIPARSRGRIGYDNLSYAERKQPLSVLNRLRAMLTEYLDDEAAVDSIDQGELIRALLLEREVGLGGGRHTRQLYEPRTRESLEPVLKELLPHLQDYAKGGLIDMEHKYAAGGIVRPVRQWLKGSVERALEPLLRKIGQYDPDEMLVDLANRNIMGEVGDLPQRAQIASNVNKWIKSNLGNYIKRDMGTEWDPLREVFAKDEGLVSVDEYRQMLMEGLDMPFESADDLWETVLGTHDPTNRRKAGEILQWAQDRGPANSSHLAWKAMLEENPWISKLNPEEEVLFISDNYFNPFEDLRFNHLIDELWNSVRQNTDLPEQLRLPADRLSRVSVPDAVRHVRKINDWRAEQMRKQASEWLNNPAVHTFKEYPEGFRWVELRKPELTGKVVRSPVAGHYDAVDAGIDELDYLTPEEMLQYEAAQQEGGNPDDIDRLLELTYQRVNDDAAKGNITISEDEAIAHLRAALKAEGDTMGHCVGGYCDEVAGGRSRIYSLRDAEGRPHVTVETRPQRQLRSILESTRDEAAPYNPNNIFETPPTLHDRVQRERKGNGDYDEVGARVLRELGIEIPTEIVQIKGKQNRAPIDRYLPFVQDFVRSGKWSRVGDLQNTGLLDYDKMIDRIGGSRLGAESKIARLRKAIEAGEIGQYLTEKELGDFLQDGAISAGFAQGGLATKQPRYHQLAQDLMTTITPRGALNGA